jgi:hypothetical protein
MGAVRVRAVLAVIVGVVALALTACGGGASDEAKIKQTVVRELAAIANGDGATACSLATAAGRAKLERDNPGHTCEQLIRLAATALPESAKEALRAAHVNRVTITGNTATVSDSDITSSKGSLASIFQSGTPPTVLTKQSDGSWKISG